MKCRSSQRAFERFERPDSRENARGLGQPREDSCEERQSYGIKGHIDSFFVDDRRLMVSRALQHQCSHLTGTGECHPV